MTRYAEKSCSRCDAIYPANMMTRITERVRTGVSETRRRRNGFMESTPSGRTEHFENRQRLLCPACARARRRNQMLAAAAVIAVLGYGALTGKPARSGTDAPTISDHGPANLLDEIVPSTASDEAGDQSGASDAVARGGQNTDPVASPSAESESSTALGSTSTDTARGDAIIAHPRSVDRPEAETASRAVISVQSATPLTALPGAIAASRAALSSGRPERWKDGRMRGYVVPSEQLVGGCRTMTFTEDRGAAPQVTAELCQTAAP